MFRTPCFDEDSSLHVFFGILGQVLHDVIKGHVSHRVLQTMMGKRSFAHDECWMLQKVVSSVQVQVLKRKEKKRR